MANRMWSWTLIATILLSLAAGSEAKVKPRRISLLRPREVRVLTDGEAVRYYKALHEVVIQLGKKKNSRRRKSFAALFWNPAFALPKEEGDICINGGYIAKIGEDNFCGEPLPGQVWEADDQKFYCGTAPGGSRKAYCNSALFLYANDKQERFCEPVENLTENCTQKFADRYLRPGSAQTLIQDAGNLMGSMGAEEIEAYHQDLEEYLDYLIGANEGDGVVAQKLKKNLGVIRSMKVVALKGAPPAPGAAAPTEKPLESVLGRELACVQQGLTGLGHRPSERYLALLAAGIQASRGPYNTNDPAALQQLRTHVISMIQAFGYCDESSYPSDLFRESKNLVSLRSLITAGNGEVKAEGQNYYARALHVDAKRASESLFGLFGLRGEMNALFSTDADWQKKNLVQRQGYFKDWRGPGDHLQPTPFEACQKNAVSRMRSNTGWAVEALNKEGRTKALKDEGAKRRLLEVSQENMKICSAVAKACALDVGAACSARNLVFEKSEDQEQNVNDLPPVLNETGLAR